MTPLTDKIVIERLAKREGWRLYHDTEETIFVRQGETWPDKTIWKLRGMRKGDGRPQLPLVDASALPRYLTSLDALQPVLKTLTGAERQVLIENLENDFTDSDIIDYDLFAWRLLTIPPKTLAFKIAEVIE